ncbi:unnamed protein product [Musa acuminata var. zebrina]
MGRGSSRSNPSRPRKKVEAETASTPRMRGPSPDGMIRSFLPLSALQLRQRSRQRSNSHTTCPKRVASSESKEKKAKKGKKSKDLSAPKRPPTAKGLV